MEVQRSIPPAPGFLETIRDLCTSHGVVLIFDECTSGFRQSFGGLHKIYNIEPDMAMFGKALGNGYPLTAVIGKESIMQAAQSTFISSTFWTDRIGSVAGIATLNLMHELSSWEVITELGQYLISSWNSLAQSHGVKIIVSGIPALATFVFDSPHHLLFKTFMTQEMLKKGYLATTACYLSIAHSLTLIDQYIESLDSVFQTISMCQDDPNRILDLLDGEVCHSGFSRLN